MLGFIIWMIYNERNIVKKQLQEEVMAGLISQAQYQKALSPWTMTLAGVSGRSTLRFYQVCGELAHLAKLILRVLALVGRGHPGIDGNSEH